MARKRKAKKRAVKKARPAARKAKRRVKTKRRSAKPQAGLIGAFEEAATLRRRLAGHNTFED